MIAKRLCFGDTIGVICPASGIDSNTINEKILIFENMGFKIKKGQHIYKQNDYLAGNDKERAADINNMFADKNIKAIICFRGGYGSIRCTKYINWNLIKKNPKIFCGYSDITLLINYINKYCNLITFHGPMINSNFSDTLTKESLFNTLMNGFKPFTIPISNTCKFYNFHKNITSGILVGGNLSIICSSLKTKYEICTKDKILLLEDINEDPYSLDRLITQLILSKKIDSCNGIILGYFSNSNTKFYNESKKVLKELLLPLNKPIIFNFPFGHEYPNLTLPIGSHISINYKNKIISINEPIVK